MLIATIATIALAFFSSEDDFKEIVTGKKIRHGLQWLFRAAVVTLVCYLNGCLLYAIPLAFLFSAIFRYRLNKKRGLDWRYTSPSSWYGCAFVWLCWYRKGATPSKQTAEIYHRNLYPEVDFMNPYSEAIHRAGTLAYIFEAVIFTAGSIICFLKYA